MKYYNIKIIIIKSIVLKIAVPNFYVFNSNIQINPSIFNARLQRRLMHAIKWIDLRMY